MMRQACFCPFNKCDVHVCACVWGEEKGRDGGREAVKEGGRDRKKDESGQRKRAGDGGEGGCVSSLCSC